MNIVIDLFKIVFYIPSSSTSLSTRHKANLRVKQETEELPIYIFHMYVYIYRVKRIYYDKLNRYGTYELRNTCACERFVFKYLISSIYIYIYTYVHEMKNYIL